MFSSKNVGNLVEPLTGRRWGRDTILRQFRARVAYLREQGVQPSDRVFIHFGNTLEFFVDTLAIWSLGGCVIPIDQRLTDYEVETLAQAAKPRLALWKDAIDDGLVSRLTAVGTAAVQTLGETVNGNVAPSILGSDLSLDGEALILFTSGTTGQPKGVVHTHRSLRARWTTLRQSLGTERYRRTLCLLPTHFGHGLICNCLFPWLSGQDLFVVPPFRADLILQLGQVLDEHRITFMSSVPSVWRVALKTAAPPKAGSVERVFCGSAPLSAHLWTQIQEWTGTTEVFNS
jgi:acyl-CoA synthetase (AMP-forming)/AMP-acid ligase II